MKLLDKIMREAERQGWTVRPRGRANGHLVWTSPSGKKVYSSKSPSCDGPPYAHLKLLRQEGFQWPVRK
jgi:hypothetical protein